jgi:hypothetical protein
MSTHARTWKKAEARIAQIFGCRRQPLSGSSGRADLSASDTTHPRLFLEVKYRDRHTVRTLWEATKILADREHKTPVLGLVDKGRPGGLIVVHSEDLAAMVAEFCAAQVNAGEPGDRLEGQIRTAFLRQRGELEDDPDDPPQAA